MERKNVDSDCVRPGMHLMPIGLYSPHEPLGAEFRRDVAVLEAVCPGRGAVPETGRQTGQTVARERRPEGGHGVLPENRGPAGVRATRRARQRCTIAFVAGQGGLNDGTRASITDSQCVQIRFWTLLIRINNDSENRQTQHRNKVLFP